jgi:hypothetical protein
LNLAKSACNVDAMFVITADQIDSTNDVDRTGHQLAELNDEFAPWLVLPADQNSGDEIQAIVSDAGAALRIILALSRQQHWSSGLGVGAIRHPLPDATRKAAGAAFIAARRAVAVAKRSAARFALAAEGSPTSGSAAGLGSPRLDSAKPDSAKPNSAKPNSAKLDSTEIEALIAMLLLVRGRRTDQGWEVVDLLRSGLSQREIAQKIGISSQAVSMRIKASLWKAEQSAVPPLVKLLTVLDHETEPFI